MMNLQKRLLVTTLVLVVAACVTINVYFPEAAAEQAATQFINGVLNDDAAPQQSNDSAYQPVKRFNFDPLALLMPSAHAQQSINIDINTPPIRAIQSRMRDRLQNELKKYFAAGAVGFKSDGMLDIRDRSAVGLADRSKLDRAVAADNQDRAAVYREIAVANGHPEWEDDIRRIFAGEWVKQAESGWYYQNSAGTWLQK